MKLLIDTKSRRVLFAEAGKDCVDFLFHVLALPLGIVIRLLTTKEMVGCLGNLYGSLETINEMYIQPNQIKDILLKPKSGTSVLHLLLADSPVERQFCVCGNYNCTSSYVTDDIRTICPKCNRSLSTKIVYVAPPVEKEVGVEGGLVKGVVTYMVLDDLVVKPMSTISSIVLLNSLGVKDMVSLEEKVVNLRMNEVLKLAAESFIDVEECLDQCFHGQSRRINNIFAIDQIDNYDVGAV